MVTDQQFKALLKRLEDLERQQNALSRSFAEFMMRSGSSNSEKKGTGKPLVKRDTTKYLFNGKVYNKRNLVLAVINQYVADKQITTSKDLQKVFPDYLQGSLGVIKKVEDAEKYVSSSQRYFFSDDKVLHLEDGTYAICKDWESKNISRFISKALEYGYVIEPITT